MQKAIPKFSGFGEVDYLRRDYLVSVHIHESLKLVLHSHCFSLFFSSSSLLGDQHPSQIPNPEDHSRLSKGETHARNKGAKAKKIYLQIKPLEIYNTSSTFCHHDNFDGGDERTGKEWPQEDDEEHEMLEPLDKEKGECITAFMGSLFFLSSYQGVSIIHTI